MSGVWRIYARSAVFVLAVLFAVGIAGHALPSALPLMLFLTPIYFLLSLIATSARLPDTLAIAFGAILGVPLYLWAPGFDLLLAGVLGGTLAHFAAKVRAPS